MKHIAVATVALALAFLPLAALANAPAGDEDIGVYTPKGSDETADAPATAAAAPVTPSAVPAPKAPDATHPAAPVASTTAVPALPAAAKEVPAAVSAAPVNPSPAVKPTAGGDAPAKQVSVRGDTDAVLAPVPGRTVSLPAAASRTNPGRTYLLWNKTPLPIALDEVAHLRNISIQYIPRRDIVITGDFRDQSTEMILRSISKAANLNLQISKDSVRLFDTFSQQTRDGSMIPVNLAKIDLYSVPVSFNAQFLSFYETLHTPGAVIIPISEPGRSPIVYRIRTTVENHAVLAAALAHIIDPRTIAVSPGTVPVKGKAIATARDASAAKLNAKLEKEREKLLKQRALLQRESDEQPGNW